MSAFALPLPGVPPSFKRIKSIFPHFGNGVLNECTIEYDKEF